MRSLRTTLASQSCTCDADDSLSTDCTQALYCWLGRSVAWNIPSPLVGGSFETRMSWNRWNTPIERELWNRVPL